MKYIFEVTMNPGCQIADYVRVWQAESALIQREPGARGTLLHKDITVEGRLVAIASWESKEMRDAAMQRMEGNPEIQGLRIEEQKLVTFKLIGEFEEPEWAVLPA